MFLQNTYKQIKSLILWLLVYFLPRPESAPTGSEVVTAKGIRQITLKLLCFIVLAMGLTFVLNFMRTSGLLESVHTLAHSSDLTRVSNNGSLVTDLSRAEYLLITLCLLYSVLMPFLRYMYKWLRVTGIIYAIAVGFILAYSIVIQESRQTGADFLAILLAVLLSLLPLYLLKYKHIKLSKCFASFTYAAFALVTLGGSIISLIHRLPLLEILFSGVITLSEYSGLRIAASGIKAVLAFFFLFIAYDRMADYVRRGVGREYEWLVAFTGFYTFCTIILKLSEMLTLMIA